MCVGLSQAPAKLGTWTGAIYAIDDDPTFSSYPGRHMLTMELETVRLDSLVFPNQHSEKPFPGTKTFGRYGMLLHNVMTVSKAGCYDFSLTSDDGSRLWLDDEEVIDNDDSHKMQTRSFRKRFAAGDHQLRLWYFNAAPTRKGLIVRITSVPDGDVCGERMAPVELSLGAQTLFASGDYHLRQEASATLDSLCARLVGQPIHKLIVVGHTDDVGESYDNLLLSRRRAGAVLQALRACLGGLEGVIIRVVGRGAHDPLVPNDSDSNRALNRRVEVRVE